MNTPFYRPSAGPQAAGTTGTTGTDYAALARAGRALQGRAVRDALVRIVRWLGSGAPAPVTGAGASHRA